MPNVTKSIEIALPADQAFALATDPARFEEWLSLHDGWPKGAPADIKPGEQFVQKLKIMGMPADVNWTVDTYDVPSKFLMSGSGPMGAKLATTVTAEGNGDSTTVSYDASFEGGGIQGPMGTMVTKKAGEEIEKSLEKLRELAG